jgi:predicted metalloprotease with PDZ domain
MKKLLLIFSLIYFISGNTQTITGGSTAQVSYNVNVTNYEDDLFHVTVDVDGLSMENDIYNLPATVPGTYSNLNFGRFVKSFKAYDENGNELHTEKISTNQWRIANADKLAILDYDIEDTFDTEIGDNKVIPMAGTGISNDFIVLNTFAVMGYFEGLQTIPVKVKLDYKSDWTVGTSLTIDENGYYRAENYDHLADNPIFMGELTTAFTTVNDIKVGVYVYSPDTTINADKIMDIAEDLLQSSSDFIGYSPVTHYNFLMCFLDQESFIANGFIGAGALEHSYCSLFVYPGFGNYINGVRDDMAHEFLHILTPLNLHSNIIQPFNFVTPTASQHIWLYEGVTEWGSDIMQLRDGLINIEEYLSRLSEKIDISEGFRKDLSLADLSLGVYSEAITLEFLNFYNKGAVTAALLDIRLLELSDGKFGLREVFIDFIEKYGKYKPFPEDEFFNIFVENTFPEIEQFINDYIKGTEPLPYENYMAKLGYKHIAERPSEDTSPTLGLQMGMNDKHELTILGMSESNAEAGLKEGDIPIMMLGTEVNMSTAGKIFGKLHSMKVGESVDIVVRRGNEEIEATLTLQQRMDRHLFEEMEKPAAEQIKLRDAWSQNL